MDTETRVHEKESEPRSMANQFRPLTTVLSIFGPYRMKLGNFADVLQDTKEPPVVSSNATRSKLLGAYPYFLLLWYIFASLIWAFNVQLDLPFPFRLAGIAHKTNGNNSALAGHGFNTNRISNIFMAFLKILENITILWTSWNLVAWFNGLTHLEREFNSHFGPIGIHLAVDISTTKINSLLVGYLLIPCILWQVYFHAALLPNMSFSPWLRVLGHAWFFTHVHVITCEPLLEDVKVFLMLHCLRKIYNTFRKAIGQHVVVRNGRITEKNVQFWLKFSTKLRRQMEQTGEYLKTPILLSVTETIAGTSVGMYLMLRFSQSEQLEQNLTFIIIYAFYSLPRVLSLYVKALLAEGIYSEERQLYEDVIDLEQNLDDRLPRTVMDKLRILRTYLRDNPAQLSLGNYVVLNKSFLIQVGIQCVTMLIAVAQFHTS